MKIRTGFVSNSSSSSFCLLGLYFENGAGAPKITTRLKCEGSISYESEDVFIGLPPDLMKDGETLLQFKQFIVDEFAKDGYATTTGRLSWHTDGGYNG